MTRQVSLQELSTVELYALWEAELAQMVREPDIPLVAACEVLAEDRGVYLIDVATLLARGRFSEALHPRGKDGQFIEIGGLIRLFSADGGDERRGRVTDIKGGHLGREPRIKVAILDDKGNDTGEIVDAHPNQIQQVQQKARLHDDQKVLDELRKKLTDAKNDDGSPAFSQQEIEHRVASKKDDLRFAKDTEAIDSVKNPFDGGAPGDTTPAPSPDHGGRPATAEDFLPAAKAEVAGNPAAELQLKSIQTENRDAQGEAASHIPGAPAGEHMEPMGGENDATISTEEAKALADQIRSGQKVDIGPPDIDDVVDHLADSDGRTDLTLLPQFSAMRENGRPRKTMPQIPKEKLSEFTQRLKEMGISVEPDVVDPADLTATQSELDGTKTGGIMRAVRAGKLDLTKDPLWVSSDGHVLDGHHRWAAAAALSSNCKGKGGKKTKKGGGCPVTLPIVRVNIPIKDLLDLANDYNAEAGIQKLAFGQDRAGDVPVPAVPVAAAALVAGAQPPVPDENGNYTMATDAEDFAFLGIEDKPEDYDDLPHGDGSLVPNLSRMEAYKKKVMGGTLDEGETPEQATAEPTEPGVTASALLASALRERVHGDEALLALGFKEELHPRGKDGEFIEIGGFVRLIGVMTDKNGKRGGRGEQLPLNFNAEVKDVKTNRLTGKTQILVGAQIPTDKSAAESGRSVGGSRGLYERDLWVDTDEVMQAPKAKAHLDLTPEEPSKPDRGYKYSSGKVGQMDPQGGGYSRGQTSRSSSPAPTSSSHDGAPRSSKPTMAEADRMRREDYDPNILIRQARAKAHGYSLQASGDDAG